MQRRESLARALAHLQRMCTADVDLTVGGMAYSLILNSRGGVARDITIARLAQDTWWILTGKGNLPAELALFRSIAPRDGSVTYRDLTEHYVAMAIWGPNSRAVLQSVTSDDVSNEAFPWYTCRHIDVGMAPALAARVSYVGELGWEIYVPQSYALHVWDPLWEAGRPFDMPAVGTQTVLSGRIEKGYRLWGSDTTPDYSPAESGLTWAMDLTKSFRGKDAALTRDVVRRVATLQFEDRDAVVYGWEPVFLDGAETAVGYITGGEFGYNVGSFIAHAFVDVDRVSEGQPVTVRATGVDHAATMVKGPLFDAANGRLKT